MSDYRINFGDKIGPSDTNKLLDLLNVVDKDDEIIITVEASDAHQTNNVINLLERNKFNVHTKGTHDGKTYNISATKRR
ncbi:hypothetical protein Q428_05330 [Fervidicella metallireducens AeB]|uniref:Uncharacterized protein n=1 Tax=Fervidicella metallireducens AeB TaxID=1403537 RepID=A0A017RVX1_9CLOT|nr:hypothetical protein [Fervidicella metallireducens]EYE88928.1 hypothetical protein Q428_05330 [Fervidicella metallireducens AeB]